MSITAMQGFKKIHKKLWEELITQTLYQKAWRTHGQTDGQGQILMPPDYGHGGIKILSIIQEGHDGPGLLTWVFQNLSIGLAEEVV